MLTAFVLLQDESFFYMQTENPAGRILYVTGNPNSNRLIILKEEKALYQKVDTNLNFVDREKKSRRILERKPYFRKKYGKP